MQTTLAGSIRFGGIGLHGGRVATLVARPAPADHGIRFRRTDAAGLGAVIPALWTHVVPSPLCTRIGDAEGTMVSTIEHLMAALAGCGVHNALIDIDGDEVPILDGSAAPFVDAIQGIGVRRLPSPLRAIRLRAPVELRHGSASARLDPADRSVMAFSIDFDDAAIGRQALRLDLAGDTFAEVLGDSRTFCRLSDVERMRAEGLALGGTFQNAVVVDGARVLSPGGLRHPNEAVRHKMLDAVGDLALAGAPILGLYTGIRAGHALTAALVRQLHATPDAWEWVEVGETLSRRLPGACVPAAPLQRRRAVARLRATA